ncbi:MAG: hypothetical protein C0453_16480, partial [Comamonadaceae bacterium]|nr:hypothetical protein [Comamonadaceae bacterium]
EDALQSLTSTCDLLEIDGKHSFRYVSIYLDTDDHHCFRDHNQSRRHRLKLRFRHYADTRQSYFEVKVKGLRNQTNKYRTKVDLDQLENAQLTPDLRSFLEQQLLSHPHKIADRAYARTIQVDYERMTLVSREEPVRITIDHRLTFSHQSNVFSTGDDLWVMEVKSEKGRSAVDRLLSQKGIRPVPRCSKYCVGLSLINEIKRINRFTSTANRIRRMT